MMSSWFSVTIVAAGGLPCCLYSTLSNSLLTFVSSLRYFNVISAYSGSLGIETQAREYSVANGFSLAKTAGRLARRLLFNSLMKLKLSKVGNKEEKMRRYLFVSVIDVSHVDVGALDFLDSRSVPLVIYSIPSRADIAAFRIVCTGKRRVGLEFLS